MVEATTATGSSAIADMNCGAASVPATNTPMVPPMAIMRT